ncbi:MAG: peptidylprolyl isomerase [Anaerolineae bacterium]
MSTTENPSESSSAEQDQVKQWLAEADVAASTEDWDRTVALYRKALEFDRYLQGVEAKLQWALRMRETENLYKQGKAKLEQGQYEGALADLRQARLKYASHYKDVDDLIVKAQTAMQKDKWAEGPKSRAAERKARRQREQQMLLGGLAVVVVLVVVIAFFATSGFGLFSAKPSPSAGATPVSTGQSPASQGDAAKVPPAQRNNMYQALPAMQIDPNKSYRATIVTTKGNIVADLFAADAPQHVNNFVFLARQGFYDNLTFHRVVPGFVIQGGDPLGQGQGGPGYTIPPEIKRNHTLGALAMARTAGPPATTPSSGSQFYITLAPQPGLDNQYTVFGQATSDSMAVVSAIGMGDVIKTITIEEK